MEMSLNLWNLQKCSRRCLESVRVLTEHPPLNAECMGGLNQTLTCLILNPWIKGKVSPVHVMTACGRNEGVTPLILNVGTKDWGQLLHLSLWEPAMNVRLICLESMGNFIEHSPFRLESTGNWSEGWTPCNPEVKGYLVLNAWKSETNLSFHSSVHEAWNEPSPSSFEHLEPLHRTVVTHQDGGGKCFVPQVK